MNQLQTTQQAEMQMQKSQTTLHKYFKELEGVMNAKNQGRVMKIAPTILQTSPLCKDNPEKVIEILIQIAQVLFGLRVENLPTILWTASFDAICERYFGLTILDLQNSFRHAQIEKKQYTTLTRDELLEPISNFWNSKMILLSEIERIQNKEREEIEREESNKKYLLECKDKYIKCLESGTWSGTMFEAKAISENFKKYFYSELSEKDQREIRNIAAKEYANDVYKFENRDKSNIEEKGGDAFQFAFIPSKQFYFAQSLISFLVLNRVKFIEPC